MPRSFASFPGDASILVRSQPFEHLSSRVPSATCDPGTSQHHIEWIDIQEAEEMLAEGLLDTRPNPQNPKRTQYRLVSESAQRSWQRTHGAALKGV
jgi:hypothetical protein